MRVKAAGVVAFASLLLGSPAAAQLILGEFRIDSRPDADGAQAVSDNFGGVGGPFDGFAEFRGNVASGEGSTGMLRARTSITADPARAEEVKPDIAADIRAGAIISGRADTRFGDRVVYDQDATFDINLFYDRTIDFAAADDLDFYTFIADQYRALGADFVQSSELVAELYTQSFLDFDLFSVDGFAGYAEILTYAQRSVVVNGLFGDPADPPVFSSGAEVSDVGTFLSGGEVIVTENRAFDPQMGPWRVTANYVIEVTVFAGVEYSKSLSIGCLATLSLATAYIDGNRAACDAGNSAYWNGMTNIRDLAGNPLANLVVTSASGFDYRYAHPSSPAPAAVGGIPEPATWAMLTIGFGLVGSLARRGRTAYRVNLN